MFNLRAARPPARLPTSDDTKWLCQVIYYDQVLGTLGKRELRQANEREEWNHHHWGSEAKARWMDGGGAEGSVQCNSKGKWNEPCYENNLFLIIKKKRNVRERERRSSALTGFFHSFFRLSQLKWSEVKNKEKQYKWTRMTADFIKGQQSAGKKKWQHCYMVVGRHQLNWNLKNEQTTRRRRRRRRRRQSATTLRAQKSEDECGMRK